MLIQHNQASFLPLQTQCTCQSPRGNDHKPCLFNCGIFISRKVLQLVFEGHALGNASLYGNHFYRLKYLEKGA